MILNHKKSQIIEVHYRTIISLWQHLYQRCFKFSETLYQVKVVPCLLFVISTSCNISSSSDREERSSDVQFLPTVASANGTAGFNLQIQVDEIVELELNESSALSNIERLILLDSQFLFFDDIEDKIVSFDLGGKHRFTIGNTKGMGPGEFMDCQDFTIVPNNRIVVTSFTPP